VVLCRRHAVDILDLADLGPTVRATAELCSNLFRRIRGRIKRWSCDWIPFLPKLKHASR